MDVAIKPNGNFETALPEIDTAFLLLLEGEIRFPDGKSAFAPDTKGVLLTSGEMVKISSEKGARLLFIAGRPLREPVAWGGPIVMNTREELSLAFKELDEGTFIKHQ
jgi:hypothetical protein